MVTETRPRDFAHTIDRVLDLLDGRVDTRARNALAKLRDDSRYSAPEAIGRIWQEAQSWIFLVVPPQLEHRQDWQQKVVDIWTGSE